MRVNLYGGPGSGKSTTAAWLFSELKTKQVSVELIGEYVKSWAYQGRKIELFDQIYLLGKQQQSEYRFLKSGVKNIITDSPCWLTGFYAPITLRPPIEAINKIYDSMFDSMNIFLHRKGRPYVTEGRYQTPEEARRIDMDLNQYLISHNIPLYYIDYDNREEILKLVLEKIDD